MHSVCLNRDRRDSEIQRNHKRRRGKRHDGACLSHREADCRSRRYLSSLPHGRGKANSYAQSPIQRGGRRPLRCSAEHGLKTNPRSRRLNHTLRRLFLWVCRRMCFLMSFSINLSYKVKINFEV